MFPFWIDHIMSGALQSLPFALGMLTWFTCGGSR